MLEENKKQVWRELKQSKRSLRECALRLCAFDKCSGKDSIFFARMQALLRITVSPSRKHSCALQSNSRSNSQNLFRQRRFAVALTKDFTKFAVRLAVARTTSRPFSSRAMLLTLSIRHFTLIESLDLEFSRGLNIITGETGAGKSIIVDALLLLFGERGSAEYVRKGAPKAVIEGTFSLRGNAAVPAFLQEHEFDFDPAAETLLLRREINERGTSRSFVNDTPATVNMTRELGNLLVDFHGQHEHQSLLKPDFHVNFIDNFDDLQNALRSYQTIFQRLKASVQELSGLSAKEISLREQAEFRNFQLQELEQLNPTPNEEHELESELSIRENAERLHDLSYQLSALLDGEDDSVRDRLNSARKLLEELAGIDKTFSEFQSEMQAAIVSVGEIAKFAQRYRDDIEFEPERLEEIRHRLQQISRLRRKYGSMEALFEKWEEFKRERLLTDNFEEEIARLHEQIATERINLGAAGTTLTDKRKAVAGRIEKTIVGALQTLGMPHIRFAVRFDRFHLPSTGANDLYARVETAKAGAASPAGFADSAEFTDFAAFGNGLDEVEFLIAANPGEELKPLARIASGGEISRVMLALKQALAESDRLPMMVFDEIDTGISGRIAQKVGKAMKDLARIPQILAITHQPQIAAFADAHVLVEKLQTKTETRINARVLTEEEHIREVARLLSGEHITDAALQSARELVLGK
jgi:DNA repair protein RecN (Recombination protein N)